jgi:hypothetical protein
MTLDTSLVPRRCVCKETSLPKARLATDRLNAERIADPDEMIHRGR